MKDENNISKTVRKFTLLVWVLILCVLGSSFLQIIYLQRIFDLNEKTIKKESEEDITPEVILNGFWKAPDIGSVSETTEGDLIIYGREIVAHTSLYLGPKGKAGAISNGMNCQNCHLDAGTKPFGNNYAAVATKYPVFRARSGTIESIENRVNDCIERSLNGKKLDSLSREMKALVAYLKWVGKDLTKDAPSKGLGILNLPLMDRPADPLKGNLVYVNYCARCHGDNGEGKMAGNGMEWMYPPLSGSQSYNTGAGLYRLSKFAGYVKANMPFGITFESPFLTDEEAWDVAAYVNSMPRPEKDLLKDWPDISRKPFDHPFMPYSDKFSEEEHKFGPFKPIIAAKKME